MSSYSNFFRGAVILAALAGSASSQTLALGEQKIAVIIANQPGMPLPYTPDEIRDIMFSKTNPSVDSYWREVSYGKTWATGNVFGPVQLDRTYDDGLNSNNTALDFCIKALAGQADFRTFNQIALIYLVSGYNGWGGHAGVAWFYDGGAVEVVFLSASPQRLPLNGPPYFTLLHELTHNLGAGHSMVVDYARDPVGPAGADGAYDKLSPSDRGGNYMTPMGGPIFGHLEAPMKYHLGWLDMGTGVKDIETGGTFRLEPLESTGSGLKALRVRRAPGLDQWFWLEYRQPAGLDGAISARTTQVFSGPLVYLEEVKPPDYPVQPCALGGRLCNPFYMLDMTPESIRDDFNDAALAAGKIWSDPYGPVTIQVGSVTADAAEVTITYTTPCATFTPALRSHEVPAATGTIEVKAAAGCNWTASTYQNPSWLTITAGTTGSGAGTVTYSVKANDTFRPRSGWIAIARQSFKVSQAFESVKPEGLRMEPDSTSGRSAVEATPEPAFLFVYRDRNGWQDIQRAYMLFNTELSLANGCYIEYDRSTNVYRLGNDEGTGWAAANHPDHPGNPNPENSYCSIRMAAPPGSNEDAAGEEFYTDLHILFKKGSIGTRNVYLRAVDAAGLDSGWKQVANWTVYLNEPPRSVAVAPGTGSGMSQTFVAEVSDPNGAIDVRNIFLLFSAPGEQRVCRVRASISDLVRVYLLADDNTSWLPAAVAGSADIRQNSQCGFLASGAVIAKSGNTVTFTLPMVFMPGFAGTKAVTLTTYDVSNVSNVLNAGTWTVPQGSCAYSFEPGTLQAGAGETKATLKLATGNGCPWLASATATWLTVTSNPAGSGPGTISYTILTNPTTAQRSASLVIGGANFVVTQSGRATALNPPMPSGYVVNGATFAPGFAGSTFITIWGTNLAPTTRTWDGSDFVNGKLPTRVEGVSVTFNGKPGYPCFISPTQLNVITPEYDGQPMVAIVISTPAGIAPTMTLQNARYAPAFFMFDPENRKYLAAVHTDGVYVGKPGLLGGAATRPAKPGDILMLFGTGFGLTNPPCPDGELLGGPCRLASPVTIKLGNVAAVVDYAGTSGHLGFDQFNVIVPNVPDGDHAVTAEIGGVVSRSGTYITVKK